MTEHPTQLPDWLASQEAYTPPDDHSHFIERNLRHIGTTMRGVREGGAGQLGMADRLLAKVSPSCRIAGLIAAVVTTNATSNMFFVYLMLAVALVLLAIRPTRLMTGILMPTLAVCALSLVLSLPALLIGQWESPVRLTCKAFVTVSLTVALARTVLWNRLIGGLRGLGCPNSLVYALDMTIQFIAILGESLTGLLEALSTRSVGRDTSKLTSAGHVLGALFLRANVHARQMSEAMECRGFDGAYPTYGERTSLTANIAYGLLIAGMVACCVYLSVVD